MTNATERLQRNWDIELDRRLRVAGSQAAARAHSAGPGGWIAAHMDAARFAVHAWLVSDGYDPAPPVTERGPDAAWFAADGLELVRWKLDTGEWSGPGLTGEGRRRFRDLAHALTHRLALKAAAVSA